MNNSDLTYKTAGVDYNMLDELKRMAQSQAKRTGETLSQHRFSATEYSRGESACVIEDTNGQYAFVQEGLGTKNLVADEIEKITGKTYYDSIAQDTVAMIVNDLITVGAAPLMVTAYWAIGNIKWLLNKQRMEALSRGWADACLKAGAFWGGGETPILSGIINENTIDLAGAAFGIVKSPERLVLKKSINPGDAIVVFESSGIHANGLTLARKVAEKLPDGLSTRMPSGQSYGEGLLAPTIIYANLVNELLDQKVDIHYMANITGHGWRKLMRATKPFTYRITSLPPVPEVLRFICEKGPVSDEEAYANFNMGAGFALFVPKKDVETILKSSAKHNIKAYEIGVVEEGEKRVIIEPKSIEFNEESLKLRD